MAYDLVKEVLDHAPADLDPTARLVLVCIAEECRGGSRMRDIPAEDICRRAGIEPRGLRHVCDRLKAAGLEVRVALGIDKRQRPVYALTGKVCRWILPPMPKPANCPCRRCEEADTEVLLREEEDAEVRPPDTQVRSADVEGTAAGLAGPPKPSIENSIPPTGTVDRATALAVIRAKTSASVTSWRARDAPPRAPGDALATLDALFTDDVTSPGRTAA